MHRVQRGRDRRQDLDAPRGAAARLRSASVKKEVDRAFVVPDADGVIRTGHYNVIQVIDGTVVTIYSWTHPKQGLVWCLASANGHDVSSLKWGGDETYAEVLFELLAKTNLFGGDRPQIQARPPLLRRCSSRLSNTRPRAVLHDRLSSSQLSSDGCRHLGGLEYSVG